MKVNSTPKFLAIQSLTPRMYSFLITKRQIRNKKYPLIVEISLSTFQSFILIHKVKQSIVLLIEKDTK